MRDPHFWRDLDPRSRAAAPLTRFLLTPFAMIYARVGARRIAKTVPFHSEVPVLCVGNLTVGGAGKTPIVQAIRGHLARNGVRAASLSRGYGGALEGPLKVDAGAHTAEMVGDEPLMLAASGETWIARRRPEGAAAMVRDGVELIVMDDGHQNPTLAKTASVVVIDASEPFGNGHVFPKGPLREKPAAGLERADGVVLMGDGAVPTAVEVSRLPVWRARLAPSRELAPGAYVAFAGIGKPDRFFDSLRGREGIKLVEEAPFPDHHKYSASDLRFLGRLAEERDARLVTTDKDHVRLPVELRARVERASVTAQFDEPGALDAICALAMKAAS